MAVQSNLHGVNKKRGLINSKGVIVVEPVFDDINPFAKNGLAVASQNRKEGFIDKSGKFVIEPQFNRATNFSDNGLAAVQVNWKWGFIDKTGKMVIEPQFDIAAQFDDNGLAKVYKNTVGYGFIDATGKYVVEPKYQNATPFDENGISEIQSLLPNDTPKRNPEYPFSDKDTIVYEVVELAEDIHPWKTGCVNNKGKIILEPKYDEVLIYRNSKYIKIKLNNKNGLADINGNIVFEPQDNKITVHNNTIFVKENHKWGIVDENDKFTVEPKFDWVISRSFAY